MPRPLFTFPDVWLGGFYELAIELGPRSDERLRLALEAIWSLPELNGPYGRRDMEPEEQPRVEPTLEAIDFGHLQGVATLPSGERVACGTFAVREEDGPDWLLLYIPMGALERVCDVGAFPFGGGRSTEGWRRPLDEWFAQVGRKVFEAAPFQLGLIGHEVSGSVYASEVEGTGVSADRWIGYLWREGGELALHPPTRW